MENIENSISVGSEVEEEIKNYKTFDEMNLPVALLRGVYAHGFEQPSLIQQKAIMPISEGRDLLAQAQSGTGKTGAFCIGSLSRIDPALNAVQVIVLAPTRELADQIKKVAGTIASFMLKPDAIYNATGGTPVREDVKAMDKGVQFLVGTPGRIYDLMHRGALKRDNVRVLVLDEADQMLEDRFKEQVFCILQTGFPTSTRIALFSATMPPDVIECANRVLNNPVRILVNPEQVTLEGIKQYYVDLQRDDWKYEALCDIYKQLNINQAIIYCNKRQRAEWLASKMKEEGFTLECIHGEMDVGERKMRMDDFRKGSVRVLISTDLLARGIDVQQVSLVINFELPMQKENYVHRIGRSGRYGRKGVAINLVTPDEMAKIRDIEKHYSTTISILPNNISEISL
jgi:translation initiation factor 4A